MSLGRWIALCPLIALACGGAPAASPEPCRITCMEECLGPTGLRDYGPCLATCGSYCRGPSFVVPPLEEE